MLWAPHRFVFQRYFKFFLKRVNIYLFWTAYLSTIRLQSVFHSLRWKYVVPFLGYLLSTQYCLWFVIILWSSISKQRLQWQRKKRREQVQECESKNNYKGPEVVRCDKTQTSLKRIYLHIQLLSLCYNFKGPVGNFRPLLILVPCVEKVVCVSLCFLQKDALEILSSIDAALKWTWAGSMVHLVWTLYVQENYILPLTVQLNIQKKIFISLKLYHIVQP